MTMYLDQLSERDLAVSIWQSLRRIESTLSAGFTDIPIPIVNVPPVDLADIVTAVTSLHPGPTAAEIADALADVLAPHREESGSEALLKVARALEKLDHRLIGIGSSRGGGGPATVTLRDGQTVGIIGGVEVTNDAGSPLPVSGTVTVANPTTAPETGLAKDATLLRRYGDHVTKAGLALTLGDNTLHTPAAGKRIRLYWVALSTSQDNTVENLIQVKLTDADGAVKYRWRMGNPGAFAGSRTIEGDVDEPLILNLANAQPVDYNLDLEEV